MTLFSLLISLEKSPKTNRGKNKTSTASCAAYGNLNQPVYAHMWLQREDSVQENSTGLRFAGNWPGKFHCFYYWPNIRDKKSFTFTFNALQPPNTQGHSLRYHQHQKKKKSNSNISESETRVFIQPKVLLKCLAKNSDSGVGRLGCSFLFWDAQSV